MRQPNKILFPVTQDFANNTSEADIFNRILKLKFKVIATIDLIPFFWQIQMLQSFPFKFLNTNHCLFQSVSTRKLWELTRRVTQLL